MGTQRVGYKHTLHTLHNGTQRVGDEHALERKCAARRLAERSTCQE